MHDSAARLCTSCSIVGRALRERGSGLSTMVVIVSFECVSVVEEVRVADCSESVRPSECVHCLERGRPKRRFGVEVDFSARASRSHFLRSVRYDN